MEPISAVNAVELRFGQQISSEQMLKDLVNCEIGAQSLFSSPMQSPEKPSKATPESCWNFAGQSIGHTKARPTGTVCALLVPYPRQPFKNGD